MRRLLAPAPVLLVVGLLVGCSADPEPATPQDERTSELADCFSVQQIALSAAPSEPGVKGALRDADAGVGFTREAMCVDFDPSTAGGWSMEQTRILVERANRDDAWAGATFERVLPGPASDEGAGSALPLVVPFDYAGLSGLTDQCFRITLEARVSRGAVEGTWSTTEQRGICPGSRYDRESLSELEE